MSKQNESEVKNGTEGIIASQRRLSSTGQADVSVILNKESEVNKHDSKRINIKSTYCGRRKSMY